MKAPFECVALNDLEGDIVIVRSVLSVLNEFKDTGADL